MRSDLEHGSNLDHVHRPGKAWAHRVLSPAPYPLWGGLVVRRRHTHTHHRTLADDGSNSLNACMDCLRKPPALLCVGWTIVGAGRGDT
eukprot:210110-Amphidinium_carterae.1